MPSLAFTNKISESEAVSGTTSFTTAATLTAVAADLYFALVACSMSAGGTINPPHTFTGGGLTWTLIASTTQAGSPPHRYFLYRAQAASPGAAAALAADFSDNVGTTTSIGIYADQVANVLDDSAHNGAAAIVQSNKANATSTGPATCSLAAFADAVNNGCYAAGGMNANTAAVAGGGMAALANFHTSSGPSRSRITEYEVGQNLAPSFSWASGSDAWGIIAVEVAAVAAGGVPVNTAVPVVTGLGEVGQNITTDDGSWTNTPTSYTVTWMRNGVSTGVTGATYTVSALDEGHTITSSVVAHNGTGDSAPAVSAGVAIPPFGPGFVLTG